MKKIIGIKFAELYLKGKNRDSFINLLFKNVRKALIGIDYKIENKKTMFLVDVDSEQFEMALNILKFVPGISFLNIYYLCLNDLDDVKNKSLELTKNAKTFKIEVKRRYKKGFERSEIIAQVAEHLLKNNEILKVDVNNPEVTLNIEVENEQLILIWINKIKGMGGFPIGINGRCLSLLSGGIDSPVASFLMQKKGLFVDYITFITNDVTEKTIDKLKSLIKKITLDAKLAKAKLYVVDYTNVQHELMHISNEKYRITLMRRSFYRIAEKFAIANGYQTLTCGDSLGQVASQTLESITTISQACNQLQILRPLLTYDKIEIIELAKKIGTYDISISEHEDVCSLFAPKSPITRPTIKVAFLLENELKLLNHIEDSVVRKIKTIEID